MTAAPEQKRFRDRNPDPVPASAAATVADVIEAMRHSIEGGELHVRPTFDTPGDAPYRNFLEIGLALRACFDDQTRRAYLIERLRPLAGVIIGTLPAGIQAHGLLPKIAVEEQGRLRRLEDVSDAELRQWVIADGGLVYGELKRFELDNYFDVIAPAMRPGGTMFDLGSGLGKVVMSAALALPFARCIGVEIVGYRHRMAQQRLAAMLDLGERALAALPVAVQPDHTLNLSAYGPVAANFLLQLRARITLIEADMFTVDLKDASLVFIYSTCFESLMDQLGAKLARELREHAVVSTTTHQLRHPAFRLLAHFPANSVTWTDVFFYERIGDLASLPPPEPAPKYVPDLAAWEARVQRLFALVDADRAAQ